MGTGSGFTKAIKPLYVPLTAATMANLLFLVDASYVLYSVTRFGQLGYDLFSLKPTDSDAVELAIHSVIKAMQQFLSPFSLQPANCVWFFEGRIEKPRHCSRKQARSGQLSKALRRYYRGKQNESEASAGSREAAAKQLISNAYGRPPPWFTVALANELKSMGFIVDYSDSVESDFRVCEFAKAWKNNAVVFSDDQNR